MAKWIGETADVDEVRAVGARFRGVADRWALDEEDAAAVLGISRPAAAALLDGSAPVPPSGPTEHRMRMAIAIDEAMRRGFQVEFNALVWLRLGARPSRLERLGAGLAEMRAVRREAEELSL